MGNPFSSFIEMFRAVEVSPVKNLPDGHPKKQYSYTLVGLTDKPISAASLVNLGFIGKVRNATDYIVEADEMLWKDLNIVIQIAKLYNIPKVRKYHDTGHGIEWEDSSQKVYRYLLDKQLFEI